MTEDTLQHLVTLTGARREEFGELALRQHIEALGDLIARLERHVQLTDSAWGAKLLDDFEHFLFYFRVVRPKVDKEAMKQAGTLEKVPLKYSGLDQWEIWVSESQERMTIAVAPEHETRFFELSAKHAVESTVIGRFTDTGKLHITYNGQVCAYVDLDLLTAGFPQWEFEAVWVPPEMRGLFEPVLGEPRDHGKLLLDMLARPNICSREWIARQYDHEVQGTSVIKPLVGKGRDVNSDAAVIRPVLTSSAS